MIDDRLQRLAEIVARRRQTMLLTKSEAARRAGISRQTWIDVEAGRRQSIEPHTIRGIEVALDFEEGTLEQAADGRGPHALRPEGEAGGELGVATDLLAEYRAALDDLRRVPLWRTEWVAAGEQLTDPEREQFLALFRLIAQGRGVGYVSHVDDPGGQFRPVR